jgi:hypothetical protein
MYDVCMYVWNGMVWNVGISCGRQRQRQNAKCTMVFLFNVACFNGALLACCAWLNVHVCVYACMYMCGFDEWVLKVCLRCA